jgi:hypoxia up-regulated 1
MQLRLRDFLGKKFNELKKTPNDVFKNPRALAKLFKESGRVKNVLSANNDHYAQVCSNRYIFNLKCFLYSEIIFSG